MQIPAQRIAGETRRLRVVVSSMISAMVPVLWPGKPDSSVRPASWHTTKASGWAPCKQAKRYAGIGGMNQRALPLDDVPMIRRSRRCQRFNGSGDEVRHNSVDCEAPAIDQTPVWPVARKSAGTSALHQLAVNGEGCVFLSDCTIGAHGKKAVATARLAAADGKLLFGKPHIVQRAARPLRGIGKGRSRGERHMQTAGDIHSRLHGLDNARHPMRRQLTAGNGCADHQGPSRPFATAC
jgi:hypothetical protein